LSSLSSAPASRIFTPSSSSLTRRSDPPARPPPQAPSASLGRRRLSYPPSRNLRNPAAIAPLCRVLRAARVVDIGTYSVDSLTAASPEAATRRSSRPTMSQCLPQPALPPTRRRLCFAHGECNPPRRRVDGSASLYGGGHADFINL
jgi:hypothetical protein